MKTWQEFCRLRTDRPFWGCVSRDGYWFDSSERFEIAVHWCCYQFGQTDLTAEQEREWFETEGKAAGLSIIHSDMLKRMYEAGLLN